jgi:hypothetical protein
MLPLSHHASLIEPPCLPHWATMPPSLSHHASLIKPPCLPHWATMPPFCRTFTHSLTRRSFCPLHIHQSFYFSVASSFLTYSSILYVLSVLSVCVNCTRTLFVWCSIVGFVPCIPCHTAQPAFHLAALSSPNASSFFYSFFSKFVILRYTPTFNPLTFHLSIIPVYIILLSPAFHSTVCVSLGGCSDFYISEGHLPFPVTEGILGLRKWPKMSPQSPCQTVLALSW